MRLLDANILIYAVDSTAPRHAPARRWLEATLSGTEPVGLAWIVVLAFLRVTTRHGILRRPLAPEAALAYVAEWMEQPCVQLVAPTDRHWPILRELLSVAGTAGNLTSDAHLAALAIEHGAVLCSTDRDFARFAGVRAIDPLA